MAAEAAAMGSDQDTCHAARVYCWQPCFSLHGQCSLVQEWEIDSSVRTTDSDLEDIGGAVDVD